MRMTQSVLINLCCVRTCSPTNPVPQPASTTNGKVGTCSRPPNALSNPLRKRSYPLYPSSTTNECSKLPRRHKMRHENAKQPKRFEQHLLSGVIVEQGLNVGVASSRHRGISCYSCKPVFGRFIVIIVLDGQ